MNFFFRNKKHIDLVSFQIGILKAQIMQDIMKKLKQSNSHVLKNTTSKPKLKTNNVYESAQLLNYYHESLLLL